MRASRGKLRFVTRGAMYRLAILFALLIAAGIAGCWAMCGMPGKSYSGPLPPLTDEEKRSSAALRSHVEKLAGEIGERNHRTPRRLQAAADWIESQLRSLGFEAARQEFRPEKTQGTIQQTFQNVEAVLPGSGQAAEVIVIGAHYDSVEGCPGANDNATGVAALLELARFLREGTRSGPAFVRAIRFVAFANEEPPFFLTEGMGSLVYARACRARGDNIVAMLSLETMGCYLDEKGSQAYPAPFSLLYPDTGNFIGFVGNYRSRRLVRACVGSFRRHAKFPSEGGAILSWVPGVGWSDHWSFWENGYPALMVTDTAPFRYKHYHLSTDTPDRVDYDRLARVVAGLALVVKELASPAEP